MNLEQMRARLAAIAARLEEMVAGEDGYTDEETTEINDLDAEFETLSSKIGTQEKVEAMKAKVGTSKGRQTQAKDPAAAVTVIKDHSARFGGFASAGEFLMAVKDSGQTGKVHPTFIKNATAYEKVGEDGGFLVPEEISTEILKKMEGDESLMSRATSFQVGGNALTINVDEAQPWNSGVQAYWTAEGAPITESKGTFKQASWRLQKVAALVKATDELLDDGIALESYIKTSAPNAIMQKVNEAILTGNGIGKPQGIINSPFTFQVAKESAQSADTIVARNVVNMYTRMFPSSRSNAIWLINPACEPQLRLIKDDNDEFIYLSPGSQLNQTPYGLLFGRPVLPLMGAMPALGDVGDIMFVDMKYYYMIRKAAGIKSATSIHLLFDREQTAFRFSMRLDGRCPFQAPVTTQYGSYSMSAFITLEAR